jgi:hypothetical protein
MIRGALAALIVTLSLAGCGLGGGGASVVPVDDAFDGMVTDVVRLDVDGGFMPLAVGTDGSVFGLQVTRRGPLLSDSPSVVVVDRDGGLTVIASGREYFPMSGAISDSMVSWVAFGEDENGEEEFRLYASSRADPVVRDLTDAVVDAGGRVDVYPPALRILDDTVVGVGGDIGTPIFFAVTAQDHVNVYSHTGVVGLGVDTCNGDGSVTYVEWVQDFSPGASDWGVISTMVTSEGEISSKVLDLSGRNTSSRPRLGIGACGDMVWHNASFADERFLVGTDAPTPSLAHRYALPDSHSATATLWATQDYVIANGILGESSLVQVSTGRIAVNYGGLLCYEFSMAGETVMWREAIEVSEPLDGRPIFECPTFVGRLAPVD